MFSTCLENILVKSSSNIFLVTTINKNTMLVNTETEPFYLNDRFIDNTLTHCLEVIETRVARKRTEQ